MRGQATMRPFGPLFGSTDGSPTSLALAGLRLLALRILGGAARRKWLNVAREAESDLCIFADVAAR